MKKILPSLFATVTLVFLWISYNKSLGPITYFPFNTRIGELNISMLDQETGLSKVNELFAKPVYINLEENSQAVTLADMGFSLNESELLQKTKTCAFSVPRLFCQSNYSGTSPKLIDKDEQKFESFINDMEKQLEYRSKNTLISFLDNSFIAPSQNARLVVDRSIFEPDNIEQLLNPERISFKLKYDSYDDKETQKARTDQLINTVSTPLLIKYGRNPVYIPAETIKNFYNPVEKDNLYKVFVDGTKISTYLDTLHEKYQNEAVEVLHEDAINAIQRALLFRVSDLKVNTAVILPIRGNPHSNGEKHDVYLEVIKSQQRLYRFENGQLTKTYVVSTGLTWETPPGEYKIRDKNKMTISYTDNWYMPHYLPIGFIDGKWQFGFHAIPYHIDAGGNIYSRDVNTMGSPATGGCIQLTPKDAEELFNWAKVDIPVYIYE